MRLRSLGLWLLCFPRRRPIIFLFLVLLAIVSITPIIIITRTFLVVHAARLPTAMPDTTVIERQFEGFTCGMHAIHMVYRSYGLDPAEERVRFRLGVDTKAVFWVEDSTGALHPDMYMVLKQDGFDVDSIDLTENGYQQIHGHLATGHMMIMLIKRRENGNQHWVAARGVSGASLVIYDSLFTEPYRENQEFVDQHVVTALALTPSGSLRTGFWESFGHLSDGSAELTRYSERISALNGE